MKIHDKSRRSFLNVAGLGTLGGALGSLPIAPGILHAAESQKFPSRPLRLITPFPVGGGPDGVARVLADNLGRMWEQPVTVENRPGGNGLVAIENFKRGAKDGHDLIQLDMAHLCAYQYMYSKLPYDPEADFKTLLPMFLTHFFITVSQDSKYRTVADLIADAKANPGKLNYGSWSVGNPAHLGGALFAQMTGTKMEHVVYRETTQLYAGVASNDLAFAMGTSGSAGPIVRTGRLRFLAVAAPKRLEHFPDVPTVAESGGPKDFIVSGWNAMATAAATPPAIATQLYSDMRKALRDPRMTEKFVAFGYEPFEPTEDEFKAFLKKESERLGNVIRTANVKLD